MRCVVDWRLIDRSVDWLGLERVLSIAPGPIRTYVPTTFLFPSPPLPAKNKHAPLADEVLGEVRDDGQRQKEGHVLVGELGDEHHKHDELRDEEPDEGVAEDELEHLACFGVVGRVGNWVGWGGVECVGLDKTICPGPRRCMNCCGVVGGRTDQRPLHDSPYHATIRQPNRQNRPNRPSTTHRPSRTPARTRRGAAACRRGRNPRRRLCVWEGLKSACVW